MNAEQKYDQVNNEGGEGYNPHRAARLERERLAAIAAPRTRDSILRELERTDCSMARESGTYDAGKVAALRAELAAMDKADDDAFAAVWTLEVTESRRAVWNAEIRAMAASNGGRIDPRALNALIKRVGHDSNALKRAIALHNLGAAK